MANPADEAREKIEARVAEIQAEEAQLNRALVHLRGTAGVTRSSDVPKPSKATSGKGTKRGQRQNEVIADIRKHPQALPREIADRIGISVGQVYGIINRLGGQLIKQANGGYVVRNRPDEHT